MFRPMPTPFSPFQPSPYGVVNSPNYTFAPTPLGQGGSSGGGAQGGSLSPDAAAVYASPIFQSLLDTSGSSTTNNHSDHHNPPHQHPPHPHPPSGHNHSHHHAGYGQSQRASGREQRSKMEPPSDLAQQEAAARDYKPDLAGPLVGEKKSSYTITQEYAKADPIYVAKTLALPQTYSHYRPIQGDGNCGWRAIGFGYFESLIRTGDVNKLQAESARLTELNVYLENVGDYSPDVFEGFTEVTLELMTDIIQSVTNGQDALPILLAKFNDEETSAPIVYHLRLLAASYLKGHIEEYQNYIPGDAASYCNEWILPVNREIDQVEVMLLFNVLLKPANVVLEIAYLDRSEGEEVNVHRMPEEAKNKDPATLGPMVYLLYRPGHYDILYREDTPPPPEPPAAPVSLQVNRVAPFSHPVDIHSTVPSLGSFSTLDMSPLAMIPGFQPTGFGPPAVASPLAPTFSSPQPAWIAPTFADGLSSAPSPISSQPSPPQTQQQQQQPPPPPPPPPPQTQPVTQQPPPPQDITSLTSLRFSKHMFPMPGAVDSSAFSPEPTFTTNTFKQSHFNTAHYNNPHFQPEEYKPDQDDEIPTSRIGGRKRST